MGNRGILWVIVDFFDKNVENSGVVPDNFGKLREIEEFLWVILDFFGNNVENVGDLRDFAGFCGILREF